MRRVRAVQNRVLPVWLLLGLVYLVGGCTRRDPSLPELGPAPNGLPELAAEREIPRLVSSDPEVVRALAALDAVGIIVPEGWTAVAEHRMYPEGSGIADATVVRVAEPDGDDDWWVRRWSGPRGDGLALFHPGRLAESERQLEARWREEAARGEASGLVAPTVNGSPQDPAGSRRLEHAIALSRQIAAQNPFAAPFPWSVRHAGRVSGRLVVVLAPQAEGGIWLDPVARLEVELVDEDPPRLAAVSREVHPEAGSFLTVPRDLLSRPRAWRAADERLHASRNLRPGDDAQWHRLDLEVRMLDPKDADSGPAVPDWVWVATYVIGDAAPETSPPAYAVTLHARTGVVVDGP